MIEDLTSFAVQNYGVVKAFTGVLMFSLTTYYSYGIVKNLREKQEYALARFFLKRKTSRSFLVISVSALVLSFGMALKNIGRVTGNMNYVVIALLSYILMLFGVLYFTFNIELITRPGLDHASREKNEEEKKTEEASDEDGGDS